ncbi:hypothetical protein Plim_1250 [Planctopirus limnophila DSM 3776]|uniref:Uncharacterized protein n=1 Tax=Planctopirus limnophila (strain ATCC 43296 / DSM 3776 / IFAM 1008 / Mu 290) TaxID=521674 RepID=D5SUN2_PLAL2|nr:hypothetical protein [Planctopirus limnophila]ADG67084.1 hypothetical protein Plim_1250 [Planctopirus limnophila DSM 3776]
MTEEFPIDQPAESQSTAITTTSSFRASPQPDTRLYIPNHENWQARIKADTEKIYCYSKLPGEDFFHLILNGEIYLIGETEKYCLRCALRLGIATQDRLFWQNRVLKRSSSKL